MNCIYNRKEAAQSLRVSVETLDRYRMAGKLSYHLIGDRIIFTESDLSEFLTFCSIKATLTSSEKELINEEVKHENS
ncbi:hypothetical protein R84B8_00618 [Treponema sp. R8-4-B8]